MKILLDTNICIYLIKKKPAQVLAKFNDYRVGEIGISTITVAKLYFGVSKSHHPVKNQQVLEQFLYPLVVASFDERAARVYGGLRAALESKGTPIGALDTLIAAQALSLGVTLVSNNTKEFERVPDLNLMNWM